MNDSQIECVYSLWKEAQSIISRRFNFEVSSSPENIILIDEDNSKRFGGYYSTENKQFHLSNQTLQNIIPIKGVVYREALYSALPSKIYSRAKYDVSCEFAKQNLDSKSRKLWIKVWNSLPRIKVILNFDYSSYLTMEWLNSLGGDELLDDLIHELTSMARYGSSLKLEEYIAFLKQKGRSIAVKLNQSDIKIITAILKNQNAKLSSITKITGLSESWISHQVKILKKKHVLLSITTTPFSRIGIRTFHLLLSGPTRSNPAYYVSKCPFLWSLQYILTGPWQVWARLAIPDNRESEKSLYEAVSVLHDFGIAADLIEVTSVGVSHSFYHYNTSNYQWNIPWLAMKGWGKRIEEESLDSLIGRIDIPANRTDIYLDKQDVEILSLVRQGIWQTRKLRKEMNIGQNKLLKKLKKLKLNGILTNKWSLYNVGLTERATLRVSDLTYIGLIDAWSRELPEVFIHYCGRKDQFVIVNLPIGDSTRLMNCLRELQWNVTILPLTSGVYGDWGFPYHLWNVDNQEWDAPHLEIKEWLESLHVHPEKVWVDLPEGSSEHVLARI